MILQSPECLARLLNLLPAAVYTCDADGVITFFNRRAAELWGQEPTCGDPAWRFCGSLRLFAVDGRPIRHDSTPMADALRTGRSQRPQEVVMERPDGTRFVVLVNIDPLLDDAGRVVGAINAFQDITLQKQAEAVTRESERQLRKVLDQTPALLARCGRDRRFRFVNRAYAARFGLTPEEIQGRSIADVLGAQAAEALHPYVERTLAGEDLEFEVELPYDQLGPRRVRCSYVAERDATGVVIGWLCVVHDVTASHAEQQRLRMQALVLEHMVEGVSLSDENGTILYTNPAEDRIFGYEPGELIGKSVTVQNAYAPEENARIFREVSAALRTHGAWTGEFANRKKDGTPFVTRAQITGLQLDGRSFWVCVQQDITEAKRIQQALRDADRRKDEFLATLAHELRNPLAPTLNAIELLRLAAGDPATLARAREALDRQVRQMVRIVDDLLDISRITSGKIELKLEPVELSTVVTSALETSQPLIAAAGHHLTVSAPASPVRLMADGARLSQALSNLLNNAARYTEPGGHISLGVEVEPGTVRMRIRDDGVGMAPEVLPHVFGMFFQGHRDERSQGGLGIGLTLVKTVVELHDGVVSATSDGPGRGSEFVIELPALVVPGQAAADPYLRLPGAPGRRLLVVDDNVDAAEMLAELLVHRGHEVEVAHDGATALELARRTRPDAMLLDLGMPLMSGLEVARRIRTDPELSGTVLVALTGWGQAEDRRRSKEAGFEHHLVKPVDGAALDAALAALLPRQPC